MRNVIAAVMASTLALSAYSQAAEVVTSVNWLPETRDSAVARAICLTA
jgi:Spy/CpxP family protein refolding chaperone